jgi:hypothetical protein
MSKLDIDTIRCPGDATSIPERAKALGQKFQRLSGIGGLKT